ncbi:MAG TPA: hypothetical protein VF483_11325 [Gemmatimonadaceae bacterium]
MSATALVFVVCVAACGVAHVAILLSSVSARAASDVSGPTASVPKPRAVSEFLWALIPILALALVFTATWARVRDREQHPPATMKVAQ